MERRYHITNVEHMGGHVLALTYADGLCKVLDFGPWLHSPRRTRYEKRYRAVQWFARVKNDGIALLWGNMLIGMASDDLRKGRINGVAEVRRAA